MRFTKTHHEWVGTEKGNNNTPSDPFAREDKGPSQWKLGSIFLAKNQSKVVDKKKVITILYIMALQPCIVTEQGGGLYET